MQSVLGTRGLESQRARESERASAQGRAVAVMQEGQDPGRSQDEGTRDASSAKQ